MTTGQVFWLCCSRSSAPAVAELRCWNPGGWGAGPFSPEVLMGVQLLDLAIRRPSAFWASLVATDDEDVGGNGGGGAVWPR